MHREHIFRIGDRFRFTDEAVANYGDKYKDKIFKVDRRYGIGEHPGFDVGAGFKYLYESDELTFAIYAFEMIPA